MNSGTASTLEPQAVDVSTAHADNRPTSVTGDLRKLLSISGTYSIGSLLQKSVGFFLIPLYTKFLGTEGYGALEILNMFGAISLTLFNLGLPSAIVKSFHQDCHSESDRRAVFSTSLFLLLPILVTGCTLILFFAPWFSYQLFGNPEMLNLLRISALWIFLSTLSSLFLALIRARQEALIHTMLSLTEFLSLVLLNIYFVMFMGLGVEGILWGGALSSGLLVLLSIPILRGRITLQFKKSMAAPLLTFGLYLVPSALAVWVVNLSDRYFLRLLWDIEEVGVYSLGYKFGMIIDVLVVWPFQLAWAPFAFSISENSNHRDVFARVLTYLLVILIFGVLTIALVSRPIINLVATEQFSSASRVVPLILLSYLFNGVVYCVAPGIHLKTKTKVLSLFVGLTAVINILLNLLLIPRFGMMGAASATALSFFSLALITFLFSNHVYPVNYEYSRIAKVVLVATALYCLGLLVPTKTPLLMILSYLLLIVAFPALLAGLRFLDPREVNALRKLWHGVYKRFQPLG